MKCPKCHNEIDNDAVFCEFCGAGIKSAEAESPVAGKPASERINPGVIAAIASGLVIIAAIVALTVSGMSNRADLDDGSGDGTFAADSVAMAEECTDPEEPVEEAEPVEQSAEQATESVTEQAAEETVAAEPARTKRRPDSAAGRSSERRTARPAPTNPEADRAAAAAAEKAAAEKAARQREENMTLYYNAANGLYKAGRYEEAVSNFRRAAECGSTAAASMLGYCYYAGTGVSKNPVKALEWWRSAAADDHAYSIYMIGYCYYSGTGVEQNFDEALRWLKRAESLGFINAREIIDDIARISSGG